MSETLVLLHGFTGGPASFDLLAALVPRARVLRPWIAGHGPLPPATSWDAEVERLLGWLDAEAVERAHLCGYSLGGRLGWALLARAPERFVRATLVGAHRGLHEPRAREARRIADRRWIDRLEREGTEVFLREWESQPIFETQAGLAPETLDAQRRIRRAHSASGLASALRALGLAEMPCVDAASIAVPVCRVVGELDRAHRALDPSATVVAGAGHNVLLERPAALAALMEVA